MAKAMNKCSVTWRQNTLDTSIVVKVHETLDIPPSAPALSPYLSHSGKLAKSKKFPNIFITQRSSPQPSHIS